MSLTEELNMSLTEELTDLVENKILKSWNIEDIDADGFIGYSEQGRNSEKLTLTFSCGKKLTLTTWCSGSREDSGFN